MRPIFTLMIFGLLLSACQSKHMSVIDGSTLDLSLKPDQALVHFYRPDGYGSRFQSSIFDITHGEPEFLGILSAENRLIAKLPAGQHRFAVIGENADFADASLTEGKTYALKIENRIGIMRMRYGFVAMENPSFQSLDQECIDCLWKENTPAAFQWAQDNMPSIGQKISSYLADWLKKQDRVQISADEYLKP